MRYLKKFNEGFYQFVPENLRKELEENGFVELRCGQFEKLEQSSIQERIGDSESQLLDSLVNKFCRKVGIMPNYKIDTSYNLPEFVRHYSLSRFSEIIIRKYRGGYWLIESRIPDRRSVISTRFWACMDNEGLEMWAI